MRRPKARGKGLFQGSALLPAWAVGGLLALLTALALLTPPLRLLEARTSDLFFSLQVGRPPAPSGRIVHVDIDDSALDTVGRWPWPRARLAEVITMLDGFGAKVIVLDLLLDDPQLVEYLPDGTQLDHDALLAQAIAATKAKVLLGLRAEERGRRLSELWTEAEGSGKLHELLRELRRDITIDALELSRRVGLDYARSQRVRARLRDFKRIAVREAADEIHRRGPVTEEAMRDALLPETLRHIDHFPELRLLREAVEEYGALDLLVGRLPAARPGAAYAQAEAIRPPLAIFSAAADGAGVVNAEQDPDGTVRRVRLRWEHDGRLYPQLGYIAAATFMDAPLSGLAAAGDEAQAGPSRLPLRNEFFLLPWPSFDRAAGFYSIAPHVSIGRILALRRARQALDDQEKRRMALTRLLVEACLPSRRPEEVDNPQLLPEIELELHEEVAFTLEDIEQVPEEKRTDKDRACLGWVALGKELAQGRRELAAAERELHAAFKDKLVLIGWNATGSLSDFYPTAVDRRTPGVVSHAAVANACLTGYAVREASVAWGIAATLLLGALASLLPNFFGPRLAFLLAVLLALLFLAPTLMVLFGTLRIYLATATPLLGIFIPWTGAIVVRAVAERRERARLTRQFGQRISKGLFEYLIENPDVISLEGEEREVTSFFSDLAGFTALSESLDSKRTVAILNRYMWAMNDELTKHYAYVNKFLGDGIMAVWGAFLAETPHAERACRAALACQRRLRELLSEPEFAGLPPLTMRIGIATGVVTVGDCGAPPDLRDYTVIGDSVNLAARLESANKQFGTLILVNQRARELAPADLLTRPLGRIAVVGQEQAQEIHELVALAGGETPDQRRIIEETAQAVAFFQARRLEDALGAFTRLAAEPGQRVLTALYLEAIERHLEHPDLPFDGTLRLTHK